MYYTIYITYIPIVVTCINFINEYTQQDLTKEMKEVTIQ